MPSASLQSPPPSDFYDDHAQASSALLQLQDLGHVHPSPSVSRTVAIIKTHALEQRLEIEPRILEANFEVSSQFQRHSGVLDRRYASKRVSR